MRHIPPSLLQKIKSAEQTLYNNAEPKMLVSFSRPHNALNDSELFYVETIREKEGLGDIAITLQRPFANREPAKVYEIHTENGIVKTATRDTPAYLGVEWIDQFEVGPGQRVGIEFDGHWERDRYGSHQAVTVGLPFLFWTNNGTLYTRVWDNPTKITLADGVTKIATIRGWVDTTNPLNDQGIIVAYLKADGKVYYRNYCMQENGSKAWEVERVVSMAPAGAKDVSLFRTNDFRVGFIVETDSGVFWVLSKRDWAGMSIPPERLTATITDISVEFKEVEPILFEIQAEKVTSSVWVDNLGLYLSTDETHVIEVTMPYDNVLGIKFKDKVINDFAELNSAFTVTDSIKSYTIDKIYLIDDYTMALEFTETLFKTDKTIVFKNDHNVLRHLIGNEPNGGKFAQGFTATYKAPSPERYSTEKITANMSEIYVEVKEVVYRDRFYDGEKVVATVGEISIVFRNIITNPL